MSLSRAVYTADGTNKQFDITFEYLTQAHVKVTVYDVDGVSNPVDVAFSFVNPTRVELAAAPVANKKVRVWRNLSTSTPYVDFVDGAELNEQNLDNNSKALLQVAQRAIDDSEDALLAAGNIEVAKAQAADNAASALASKNAAAASEAASLANKNATDTNAASALASKNSAETARDTTLAARDVTTAARDVTTAARDTAVAAKDTTVGLAAQVATDKSDTTTAKNTAVQAATDALAAFDSFDDRYLGAKATAPATDNDGNALIVGALYYHTASTPKEMRVWNGAAWEAAYAPISGYATVSGAETLINKTIEAGVFTNGITEEVYAIVDGASVDLNPANGSIQTWTLGASRTPTAGSFANGQSMTLMLNDGAGFAISAWPSVVWTGGSAPSLATTGYTVICFWKVAGVLYGVKAGEVA